MTENIGITKEIEETRKKYEQGDNTGAISGISSCIDSAVKNCDKKALSVCLGLKSLYLYGKEPFINVMRELENANFFANTINFQTAKDIINFIYSFIFYKENDINLAKKYYKAIRNFSNIPFDINRLKFDLMESDIISYESNPMIALINIAKTISSKTNIDSLLKTIADETTHALNAERCSVFILDKDTEELWSKVATGIDFEEIRFPMNKGLAGYVAMTGETVNIKDAYSDNRFNKEIDLQTGYHTKNILCMPIRNMQYEIIGVLQVLNKIDTSFSNYDEQLLVTISMNAGIAIENSRLFERQKQMLEEQKMLFASFIDTLVASIDARDKITSGHSTRVKLYAQLICEQMQIEKKEASLIEQAAILHDIGKIGIKDAVLQKEGQLTAEEYAHIQEHAKITYDILSKIYDTKNTEQISLIASTHHEKYNGTGYYKGLAKTDIPLGGRILAVADVFDAITSKRHYRDKMPIKDVISIIIKDSGTHFDPNVTDKFLCISCDKILDVILYQDTEQIVPNDRQILSKYSLNDLYDAFCKSEDDISVKQKDLTNLFKKYYRI
ncbi:GAF domain-containing protein [bacterium]|nr:GAF domain-containing protein [bacterium]